MKTKMCGRYNNHRQAMEKWAEILKDWPTDDERLSYNVCPTDIVPIVTKSGLRWARWGMVHRSAREFKSTRSTSNARIETVTERPTFRDAWRESRTCLVPAAGYFEWPDNQRHQPYYFHTPDDTLVFAGIWEPWRDQVSCTFLTENPRGNVVGIHDRMPVMLTPERALQWLVGGTKVDPTGCNICENLVIYPVNPKMGKNENDGPHLIERCDPKHAWIQDSLF